MKTLSKQTAAKLEMLVCAALWSTAGIFIKLIPWNAFVISGVRSAVSAVVLAVYIKLHGMRFIVCRKTVMPALLLTLTYVCFVAANKLTTAANAIVLQFTAPVFILIFSVLFLKQRFQRRDVLAVICTLAGIALFFLDRLGPGHLLGNVIAVCAGASMGGMYITIGGCLEEERMSAIFLAQLFTAAVGIPFAAATRPAIGLISVLCILALGVFQLGIPYILYGKAAENCSPLVCSLLGAVEPLLNPVWVLLFDGETPGIFALIGGVVVIVTIVVWSIRKEKSAES